MDRLIFQHFSEGCVGEKGKGKAIRVDDPQFLPVIDNTK